MLVLTRKTTQEIWVGKETTIRVLAVHGDRVVLGIDAPLETKILRGELLHKPDGGNETSSEA